MLIKKNAGTCINTFEMRHIWNKLRFQFYCQKSLGSAHQKNRVRISVSFSEATGIGVSEKL